MIQNKVLVIFLGLLIIIGNILLWHFGVKNNNANFMNITLMGILSLDVSVVVSVYLVQCIISRRRRYDYIAKLFDSILEDLGKNVLLNHEKHAEASLLQRYVSNKLFYISKAVPHYVKKDMDYVIQSFERIQTFYGDHGEAPANDIYYEREKVNMSSKVAKIQLALYGFNISDKS